MEITRRKKHVRFSEEVQICRMYTWEYARRRSRKNDWMIEAVDRFRFERRIRNVEIMLNPILIKKQCDMLQCKKLNEYI